MAEGSSLHKSHVRILEISSQLSPGWRPLVVGSWLPLAGCLLQAGWPAGWLNDELAAWLLDWLAAARPLQLVGCSQLASQPDASQPDKPSAAKALAQDV